MGKQAQRLLLSAGADVRVRGEWTDNGLTEYPSDIFSLSSS